MIRNCGVSRLALALLIFAALPATLLADSVKSLKLVIAGRNAPASLRAESNGADLFIPTKALKLLQLKSTSNVHSGVADIELPQGRHLMVALVKPGNSFMVPWSSIAGVVHCAAVVQGDICRLLAHVTSVTLRDSTLTIATSLPLHHDPKRTSDGQIYTIDLEGAAVPTGFALQTAELTKAGVVECKSSSTDRGTLIQLRLEDGVSLHATPSDDPLSISERLDGAPRIASRTPQDDASTKEQSPTIPSRIATNSTDDAARVGRNDNQPDRAAHAPPHRTQAEVVPSPIAPPQAAEPSLPVRTIPAPTVQPAGSVTITGISYRKIDSTRLEVHIATTGPVHATAVLRGLPAQLVVQLGNAVLAAGTAEWSVAHPLLSSIQALVQGPAAPLCLALNLTRVVSYSISGQDDQGITVTISLPHMVHHSLSSSTIVVDAGHGGPAATGCSVPSGSGRIYEKNITLSVALKLRRLLDAAGVNVLMTRTTDQNISLDARPKLANDNNADMFVSIHIDDVPIPNSASGSTSYYHMDNASSRALAHSLISHLASVNSLPDRGARSDRVLYPHGGLAVLRGSAVPATLVELGFLNNGHDRAKLLNDEYQDRVAQALFAGIRDYIEGSSDSEIILPVSTR